MAATAALVLAPLSLANPASAEDVTPAPSASDGRAAKSFVLGIKHDIDSLNPFVGVQVESFEAYQLMYDYLTGSSEKDFSPVPGLAQTWDTSTDGKTWTFHLRPGVTWSDGKPLTSADVVYSFKRVMTADTVENGQYGNYVTYVTDVTAPDANTVVFTTSEPTPAMLRMAVPILPEHIWKDITGDKAGTYANDTAVVGSGPFTLVEVRKGQFYRFSANKSYWAGAPKIDELVLRIFADDEAMVQAITKGEIDMVQDISAEAFDALANQPGITRSDSKYSGFNELAFNLGAATVDNEPIGDGHPALKDKQVRLAIDYAIDRQALVDKVLNKHGSVASGVIPPVYPNQHWNPGAAMRGYDPAKANQLLDAAGYARGSDGIRVGKDGKALKFRLFGRNESKTSTSDVAFIREWLKDIGIDVTIQNMSEDQLTDVVGKGEFDMFEWGWVVEPDPDFQLSVFTCDQRSYTEDDGSISAGWSDSFFCDAAFDDMYLKQKTLINAGERDAAIKRAQQYLYDNAVYSMLFYYNNFEAYRSDRFTGLVHQPTDGGTLVFQYGTHSYRNMTPVDPAQQAADQSASDNRTLIILVSALAAVVVIGAIVTILVLRRRKTADERE
jgi:peptide/nickel transport system substrate-binding protein